MPGAEELAGPADLEIFLRELEAIVGFDERMQAGFCRPGVRFGKQQSVTLVRPAADPAAELMQLREPEMLRAVYHHHGGVRNVHADLDD